LYHLPALGTVPYKVVVDSDIAALGFPLLAKLIANMDPTKANTFLKICQVPALLGEGVTLRSPFCNHQVVSATEPCTPCFVSRVYIRNANTSRERVLDVHATFHTDDTTTRIRRLQNVKHTALTHIELVAKVKTSNAMISQAKIESASHKRTNLKIVDKYLALKEQVSHLSTSTSINKFAQDFRNAQADGVFKDHEPAKFIIESLIQAMSARSKHGKRITLEMKQFYAELLVYGGPQIHDYVSEACLGPHVDTTRDFLAEFKTGTFYEWSPSRFQKVKDLLGRYNIMGAPCIVVEDGTALVPHMDVIEYCDKVVMLGAVDGPHVFNSFEEVDKFATLYDGKAPRFATTFHLYMLVPLVDGTPSIPLVAVLQDNSKGTYNAKTVMQSWRRLWQLLLPLGVNLVGHSGDGAGPFRSAALHHMMRKPPVTNVAFQHRMSISSQSPLIQLILPLMNGTHPILIAPDWMHILFRLRSQFLDPKRALVLFGCGAFHSKLITWELLRPSSESFGLKSNDTNASDKQNLSACFRFAGICICPKTGKASCHTNIIDKLKDDGDHFGVYMFLTFMHKYTKIFLLPDMTIEDTLKECGWCLAFIGYWDMSLSNSNGMYNKKQNFLTLQTKQDVIISLNVVVLSISFFSQRFPNFKFNAHRLSSRPAEHKFKELRARIHNNDTRITSLSGMYICEIDIGLLQMQVNGVVKVATFQPKRKLLGRKGKFDDTWNKMPRTFYPSVAHQEELLTMGAHDLITLLRRPVRRAGGGGAYIPWSSVPKKANSLKDMAKHLLRNIYTSNDDWDDVFNIVTTNPFDPTPRDGFQYPSHLDDIAHPEDVEYAQENMDEYFDALVEKEFVDVDTDLEDIVEHSVRDVASSSSTRTNRRNVDKQIHDDDLLKREDCVIKEAVKTKQQIAIEHVNAVFESWKNNKDDTGHDEDGDLRKTFRGTTLTKAIGHQMRALAKKYNNVHKPNFNVRQGDRFHALELADRTVWVTDEHAYEDEDCVAICFEIDGVGNQLWFASIEKCYRNNGKGVANCHAVHHADKHGMLVLQCFEPIYEFSKRGGKTQARFVDGCLKFTLPVASSMSYNDHIVRADTIIQIVRMTIPTLPSGLKASFWVLNQEDERSSVESFHKITNNKSV